MDISPSRCNPMNDQNIQRCTAFAGTRRIASGSLAEVAVVARRVVGGSVQEPVLIFDDETSHVVDVDFRGTDADVIARIAPPSAVSDEAGGSIGGESPYREGEAPRGRGRPKLGVVAREVTLLPRHW